jgi:hypothetical protein
MPSDRVTDVSKYMKLQNKVELTWIGYLDGFNKSGELKRGVRV